MPELSMQIVEYAREHGRVTIGDMVALTATSRNTLKQHFRQLLKKGHLVMHCGGRGARYALACAMCGRLKLHTKYRFPS